MNDLMRTSMITFSQKIYGWGQSSFDFNSNHYFDFIEQIITEDREYHYWESPEKLFAKYFCGMIIPTRFLSEFVNIFWDKTAFYNNMDNKYSIFMFSIHDEEELNRIAKHIYNCIKRDEIKHMLLCSAGDVLDEL